MEIAVLAGLGLGGYLLTQQYEKEQSKGDKDMADSTHMLNRDMLEAGIPWGNQKVADLNLADLNSANTPYTAPLQESTNDFGEVALDQAQRTTYVKSYVPDFYFRNNIEFPITSAAAGVYNIEIPSEESIRGDPTRKLARFPRVYIDSRTGNTSKFAGDLGTMGAMGASEPEIWEERDVPPEGQLNFEMNPYGPGGAVQDLMNRGSEALIRARGCNQSTIVGPPMFGESRGFIG
jgi:hypothetical protein